MSLVKCPECGNMMSDKAVACPGCGAPNTSAEVPRCHSCNTTLAANSKFCPNCGEKQVSDDPVEESGQKSRKLYLYMLITAVVLIFIIIVSVLIRKIDRPVDAVIASADSTETAVQEAELQKEKTARDKKVQQNFIERSNPGKFL